MKYGWMPPSFAAIQSCHGIMTSPPTRQTRNAAIHLRRHASMSAVAGTATAPNVRIIARSAPAAPATTASRAFPVVAARSQAIRTGKSAARNIGSERTMTPTNTIGVPAAKAAAVSAAAVRSIFTQCRAKCHAKNAANPIKPAFTNLKIVTFAGNAGNSFHTPASSSG
jgi:hypothetical protein